MAEAVVSLLVERLGPLVSDLIRQESKLLCGVSDQVEQLQVELKRMRCFLKDADKRQDETERVRNWVAEIREAAYDVEDVIETYALKVALKRGGGFKNGIKRFACILAEGITVHQVGSEIKKITTKISNLTTSLQTYGIKESSEGGDPNPLIERQRELRQTYSHVEDADVVGFEKNIEELVECLVTEEKQKQHRVVSICGMGGLGKTTLAKKVYHHDKVKRHFDCRAWAYISQQCQKRQVWEGILFSLVSPSDQQMDEIKKLSDAQLSKKLYQIQQEKKCLVILDDIWKEEAWDMISAAFPSTNTDSKILLTSRNEQVALQVDPRRFPHELQCLDDEQSWTLLQKKAISWRKEMTNVDDIIVLDISDLKKMTANDFEVIGKKMVQCCKGLPLAITILGGLLATKQTLEEWKEVHEHVKLDLHQRKDQRFSQVLTLSYDDLPYHLKPCFLYLGHFPEDFEIPTKKLIRMWMAEGFISPVQEIDGRVEKMEDMGERYLRKLVQRCMVQVGEKSSTPGRIKTCRLHDVIRDLCLSKAEEENFLQCINYRPVENVPINKVRRFSIFCVDEIPIKLIRSISQECPHIRSLLYFTTDSIFIENGQLLSSMFKDFKLLRVLNLEYFCCDNLFKLSKEIGHFIHLRFLTLKGGFLGEKVWSSIGHLRCLQTLDLRDFWASDRMILPFGVIKEMKQLRHLYLPICEISGKWQLANLSHLQTLVNIPLLQCDLEDIAKLTNLTKLKIQLEEGTLEKDLMPTLGILRSLCVDIGEFTPARDIRPIVSGCPNIYKLSVLGGIEKLPEVNQISLNLTKLLLAGSYLEEDPMPTLEKLPKLKILRILYAAFGGKNMVCSARGFPQLQSLFLGQLRYIEEWTVEEGAMPSLCRLEIKECEQLKMVPEGLRFVTTLQELEISSMPVEFKRRVDKEGQDFYKIQHVPSVVIKSRD